MNDTKIKLKILQLLVASKRHVKINSKWIKRLECKIYKINKALQENMRVNLF